MRHYLIAVFGIIVLGLSGCTGDGGYEGFSNRQGVGLNSPYDTNDTPFDDAKFTVRPFNVTDAGFTTRPFRIGLANNHRILSFLPVDRRELGSLLLYVVEGKNILTAKTQTKERNFIRQIVPEPGSYQVKVSYPVDGDEPSRWKVEVQRVEEIERTIVAQPNTSTKTAASDGVTSTYDFTSKVLDETKFSTTPVRVGRGGYTTLPLPVGDADHDGVREGDDGGPLTFIPVDRHQSGTLLVVVSTSATVDPQDYIPETSDSIPEDSAVGFSVKPGVYQVEVSYRDGLSTGWTVVVQRVTIVS